MIIYDISPDILKAEIYGEDTKPNLKRVSDIRGGCEYNLSDITMCLHTGAHIDAPLHFVENGKPVDELSVSQFVGRCVVASANGPVTAQWIERNLPWDCKRLLIKCGGNGYLMDNAVNELCRFNISLVGIDSVSISSSENEGSVHRELMYNNIAILEGIDLTDVKDGEYFLFAAPIKIGGAEAAPCRALLIKGIIATESSL
ncbi:MAG: cyclase family protein [Clostridiales bacterium]|nr:cyclase family protein [Clostridiales bacterium]